MPKATLQGDETQVFRTVMSLLMYIAHATAKHPLIM